MMLLMDELCPRLIKGDCVTAVGNRGGEGSIFPRKTHKSICNKIFLRNRRINFLELIHHCLNITSMCFHALCGQFVTRESKTNFQSPGTGPISVVRLKSFTHWLG